jgi:hypothetical protein
LGEFEENSFKYNSAEIDSIPSRADTYVEEEITPYLTLKKIEIVLLKFTSNSFVIYKAKYIYS